MIEDADGVVIEESVGAEVEVGKGLLPFGGCTLEVGLIVGTETAKGCPDDGVVVTVAGL